MTQENKQLLLQDLCARVPYGVKCRYNCVIPGERIAISKANAVDVLTGIEPMYDGHIGFRVGADKINALEGDIRPFLRPMSSMTEEEKDELAHYDNCIQRTDFFYSHHIDCRGLIEKGLAVKVTKENNPYKD